MWQCSNSMNERIMLERNKIMSRWCILVNNKKLWTFVFGNCNKTRTNSFLEMGKSSSNVPNVFKGLSLTGYRVIVYLELRDIYYILQYFLIHCTYSKILNGNKELCCLCGNVYLSEVSIPSFLDCGCGDWRVQAPMPNNAQLTKHCKTLWNTSKTLWNI